MTKYFIFLALPFFLFTSLEAQVNSTEYNKYSLTMFKNPPNWCNECKKIYIGDYSSWVTADNPNLESPFIIAIIGDQYQKPKGIKVPYQDFISVLYNNKFHFLQFKSIKKINGHYMHLYETGKFKITLDYTVTNITSSGLGDGGVFKFYVNGILTRTLEFWIFF
jgi:hypothetical protein